MRVHVLCNFTGNCEADSTTTSAVTNDLNTTEVDTVTLTDGSRSTGMYSTMYSGLFLWDSRFHYFHG